jgi:lipopolysaccharide assembly outer membrane protein LptD (OstA)
MTTDTLDWQKGKDLVSTPDKVFIKQEKMDATGTGLTAQPGLKVAQLNKDVTVKMNTQSNPAMNPEVLTITCDGPMEIDQAKNQAVFNTNVVAVQVGRELKTDRMELYFDLEAKQIKEIICLGHVIITQGENKTYADKAVYDAAEKKMTLSGRPKLIMITSGQGGLGGLSDMMKSKDKKPAEESK